MKTVLLDTSVQIERLKGSRRAPPVETALARFGFRATTTYARYEFKQTWLKDLAFLHQLACEAHRVEDIVLEIDRRLAAHPAQRRRLQRVLQAITAWLEHVPGSTPYGEVVGRYREHLAQAVLGAYTWWMRSTTYEFDGTGCVRAKEAPRRGPNGRLDCYVAKCRARDARCRLKAFYLENREAFAKVAFAVKELGDSASDELRGACGILAKANDDPDGLCDSDICRKLGDLLIAVDGRGMSVFAANNDKEWKVLADALGRELLNPVPKA